MNQVTIGNRPDFVMRAGVTTYSHHVSVKFTPEGGTTMNDSTSDRSLHALLKELKQKLVPKGWNQTLPVKWVSREKLKGTCETKMGAIVFQYHFIAGLTTIQKMMLNDQIIKEFEQILP